MFDIKKVEYRISKDRKSADVIVNDDMLISSLDVHKTEEGEEYINVLNLFRPDGTAFEKWRFSGRIGDMVETIRRGWGDAIASKHLIVSSYEVRWFLDRRYGEYMRRRSIKGWGGVEFAWAITVLNSITGSSNLNIFDDLKPLFPVRSLIANAEVFRTHFFDTKEEAESVVNKAIEELQPMVDEYYGIAAKDENDPRISELHDKYFKDLTGIKRTLFLYCKDEDLRRNSPIVITQVVRRTNRPYKTKVVYTYTPWSDEDNFKCYLCQGDAYDDLDEGVYLETEKYLFTGESEEMLPQNPDEVRHVYRIEANENKGPWFATVDECFDDPSYKTIRETADKWGYKCRVVCGEIYAQKLFPVIPSEENTQLLTLENGKKGLVGRANFCPDEVGSYSSKRKAYFPDRSCKDKLCAGTMVVTGIKDHGNYGFVTGRMYRYETPTEDEIIEWILDEGKENCDLTFVENAKWGSAIMISTVVRHGVDFLGKNESGEVRMFNELSYYDHDDDTIVREISAFDFVSLSRCGMTREQLHSHIGSTDEIVKITKFRNYSDSPKFISADFDEAADIGFVELLRFSGVDVCYFCTAHLLEAVDELGDAILNVIEDGNRINAQATERLVSMRKKGKI